MEAGVTVGLGPQGTEAMRELSTWAVRNLRFDAGWVSTSGSLCRSVGSLILLSQGFVGQPSSSFKGRRPRNGLDKRGEVTRR